jgi:hypothetical protein
VPDGRRAYGGERLKQTSTVNLQGDESAVLVEFLA